METNVDAPPARDDSRDDAALVALCNEGDVAKRREAFGALYRRYLPCVERIARRFAPDEATAEDATQDTFEWLLRQLPPHGTGIQLNAKVTTLLYPVARHAAQAAGRRATRCAASAMDPDDLPAPEEAPVDDTLDKGLAALPPLGRQAMLLHLVDGLTYLEISARLGVPVGTAKSRVCIATRRLRKWAARRGVAH